MRRGPCLRKVVHLVGFGPEADVGVAAAPCGGSESGQVVISALENKGSCKKPSSLHVVAAV